jgi:cytochrome c biogenesis protein ResB
LKQPQHFEFKKWLCNNIIIGLKIHYFQTGTDTSATEWELIPADGKSKRVTPSTVESLVTLRPDWVRVLQVKDSVRSEVAEHEKFAKKEANDLSEFDRLKAKFAE